MASLLPVQAAEVEVPLVSESQPQGHRVEMKFPEPLVSVTTVGNGRGYDGYAYTDKDLGRDMFTITGDDKHKPITRWTDQDLLSITFPEGTSCATEYTFQINEGTTYLGGAAVPTKPVKFRCPPDSLSGHSFMDARGLGVMVCPTGYLTRESREFSPETPLRFVFRKPRVSFWTNKAYYVGGVEAVVEPAYLKQGPSRQSLKHLQDRGKSVWSQLNEESQLPGHVVVRPVKPLDPEEEWHLLVEPEEGQGFSARYPVCSAVQPLPELGTGVEWNPTADDRGYRLKVSFSNPMSTADLPKLFERMQLAVGANVAKSDGAGRKTLQLDGHTLEFRYAGEVEPEIVRPAGNRRYWSPSRNDDEHLAVSYKPQGQSMGFLVDVNAAASVLLDVVLPADTQSYLGLKVAGAHRHRIALNPAWPALTPGKDTIVPLKGDRCLRVPCVNLQGVNVQAWRLPHAATATAWQNPLSNTSGLMASKLEYDLLSAREWRGLDVPEEMVNDAEDAMVRARKTERDNAARSRLVLKDATAMPGCRVPGVAAGMMQSGEALLQLDDALGGTPEPGMYLLRLLAETNAQVRSSLRQMNRAEESLDASADVVVQVTDLNVTVGEDAILVNRYSDGSPVEQGTISWLDRDDKPQEMRISNGIAWLPDDYRGGCKAWVRAGNDTVLINLPWSSRLSRYDDDQAPSASTMLVLDRPIYRPGDEVHLRGVLRHQLSDGSCAIPEERTAQVIFRRPNGSELETREVQLSDYGAFEATFTLPTGEDDVTGNYELRVKCADFDKRTKVNCQVFRRDAFKTTLEMDVDPVAPESFTLRVAAEDYSGTPLGGASCCLKIGSETQEIILDAGGKASLTCPVTLNMRKRGAIEVSGDVVNDREEYVVIKTLRKPIYEADFRIELRRDRIVLIDSRTDKPLSRVQKLHLCLLNSESVFSHISNGFGLVADNIVPVWQVELTVPANSELGVPLPLNLDDWYNKAQLLEISGQDAAGRVSSAELSVRGAPYRMEKSVPELKAAVKDGAVELLVDLPYACQAHVLVGCGVKLRHLNLPVQAGQHTYRVPLEPGEEGKLSISLVLPGQNPGDKAICTTAGCFAPIEKYHLEVALQLPQQVCRPAETITLTGQVKAAGQPADAEVTLYAVDAGMLSVGKYEYPDPEAFFCAREVRRFFLNYEDENYRRPSVRRRFSFMPAFWRGDLVGEGFSLTPHWSLTSRTGFARGVLRKSKRSLNSIVSFVGDMAHMDGMMQYEAVAPAPCVTVCKGTGEEGGPDSEDESMDGGNSPRLRSNFAPVAVWKGALRTDAAGAFSAEVTLPDTLTTYEVIAVAVDRSGKRFGKAKGEFTVAQPVMLTPGTPLFMSLGDELRLPLSIVNNTDATDTWTVTLAGAAAPQQITLEPHGSGTLFFDFNASAEGEQKLRWTAMGESGSDAVQGEFSVRFPAPVLKEVHRLTLSPGEAAVQLAALLGEEVGTATRGELELVVSANPLLHLAGVADFLLQYPYGCTEQRASALIPWLLYDHLAPFCPKMAQTSPETVKEVVRKSIDELLQRLCKDGGLSYWPGLNKSSLWATAHAGYVLKLAQEMGYDVPEETMNKIYRYLWLAPESGESYRTRFAIARTRGKTGQMKDILHDMLDDMEERDWVSRETMSSLTFMLCILENPAGADAAFRDWMRAVGRDYRHGCTQSNAWTLLALVEYLKIKKEQGGEATLTLQDGSQMKLDKAPTTVTLPWQPGQEMKSLPTTLAASSGTVYAALRVRALPPTTDFPGVTEHGMQVTRLYETRGEDGVWRPTTSFKVGDVVRVTLTCAKVAGELKYLVLEDYLPSCMEAINPNVPSQAVGLPTLEWSHYFDYREYLADRVRGFCTRWEGHNLLNMRYYARVKRAGISAAPPAQAQLMYEPQVYGLSPNTRIVSEP